MVLCSSLALAEKVDIKLPSTPALSTDGSRLVFEWAGDLWVASSDGGKAVRISNHPARDNWPQFSPDGKQIAFMSKRDDTFHVYVMPSDGGTAKKITSHSEGCLLAGWWPDGKTLLIQADRDNYPFPPSRFFQIKAEGKGPESLLFDTYGKEGTISPAGDKLLFVREGIDLFRKGYKGSGSAQIWMCDLASMKFTPLCVDPEGSRSPMWAPDGKKFYYSGEKSGCYNIWEYDLVSGVKKQLTFFKDDPIIIPVISANGRKIVFRCLADFHVFEPLSGKEPQKIDLWTDADDLLAKTKRRWYASAGSSGTVDFADDGLEIALSVGGRIYVMDTVFREPVEVTADDSAYDYEPVFSPDRMALFFLHDTGDKINVWKAERSDPVADWWKNRKFKLSKVTDDEKAKSGLSLSPDGKKMAFNRGRGELCICSVDGSGLKVIADSPNPVFCDWSPDSQWLVCCIQDSDSNADVFIVSADGSSAPYNISRHPNWDYMPRWSPDGKVIAFGGRRYDEEANLFYVWLSRADEEMSARERVRQKAEKVLNDARRNEKSGSEKPAETNAPTATPVSNIVVNIDFDGLEDRIHRIPMRDATPGNLFWSFDSKALVFSTTINGRKGTYKINIPDNLSPDFMTDKVGTQAKWIKRNSTILWTVDGVPAAFNQMYDFKVFQTINAAAYRKLGFRMIWRTMRDSFYDSRLNNLNWNKILVKYEDMAANAADHPAFYRVVNMLLGELNASHTGFQDNKASEQEWLNEWDTKQWKDRTATLGLRFDDSFEGPGLKVSHVIKGGPCDAVNNKMVSGDILLSVNGAEVGPDADLAGLLTGLFPRDIKLKVKGADGAERDLIVEEKGFDQMKDLVRDDWVLGNRRKVEQLSQGTLGYLSISKMQNEDLRQFERTVYEQGVGRDGIVIDVRNNPGGFIADQLLSILCRARHSVTVPRDGEQGYISSYTKYVTWNKPIVVLCNQYSTSNAEIFSHAIKTLKRGKLVGVPTQGAVIATPDVDILDLGKLSVPERGFFTLNDGQDMELNGCVPDYVIWPEPGEQAAGIDRQLEKAVEVLLQDVKDDKAKGPLKLIKASERGK